MKAGPAVALGFGTGVRKAKMEACSAEVTVRTVNSAGQVVNVTQATTVDLAGAPATFFSDAKCTIPVTSMVIPSGGHRILFYFSSLTAGSLPITATATGLTQATQTETVTTAPTHSVTLTWNASTSQDVASYNVYRGIQSGGPYEKIASTEADVLTYVDSDVVDLDTYYYVVTAVDTNNQESGYSNQSQATIP